MKNYILPENIGQSLVNYLQQKPWAEVNGFIAALQNLQPMDESADKPAEATVQKTPSSPAVVPDEGSG